MKTNTEKLKKTNCLKNKYILLIIKIVIKFNKKM